MPFILPTTDCSVELFVTHTEVSRPAVGSSLVPLVHCRQGSKAGCVQVVADITTAIKGSAKAGVAHRDITPNNFGHIDGRGFLYDFSAGKVSA